MKHSIKLDKERELRYDFRAFLRLDEECGINALDPSTFSAFSPKQAVALVWAGQLNSPEPLSRDKVAEYIPTDGEQFVAMMTTVSKALAHALGAKTGDA